MIWLTLLHYFMHCSSNSATSRLMFPSLVWSSCNLSLSLMYLSSYCKSENSKHCSCNVGVLLEWCNADQSLKVGSIKSNKHSFISMQVFQIEKKLVGLSSKYLLPISCCFCNLSGQCNCLQTCTANCSIFKFMQDTHIATNISCFLRVLTPNDTIMCYNIWCC